LWLEARRRPPQPKLKRKFVKQLLRISLEPITPKHQPPKIRLEELVGEDWLFFGDFADFANVINERLSEEYVRGSWWLEELPETSLSGYTYNFGRSYAVFYNRAQVGKLEVMPRGRYSAEHPDVITHIRLYHLRLLPFAAIRDFFTTIASYTCYDSENKEKHFQTQQEIDRAMTEVLWRNNQIVYDYPVPPVPDTGEIDWRLNGVASRYLERRERLRNQATSTALADETMKPLTKTETQKSTKRWSLARAGFYGLLLSGVVFAAHMIAGPPDPWLRAPPAELLAYLAGNFAPAPIIFVLIAATRNAFYGLRPW
jgi:hypothetical protein